MGPYQINEIKYRSNVLIKQTLNSTQKSEALRQVHKQFNQSFHMTLSELDETRYVMKYLWSYP